MAPPKRNSVAAAFIVGLSMLHAAGAPVVAAETGDFLLTTLWVLLPAFATLAYLAPSRRHGYHRWLVVVVLANIVEPLWTLPVLVVSESWVLYRFWVVEHPGQSTFTGWVTTGRAVVASTPAPESAPTDATDTGAGSGGLRRRGRGRTGKA